MAQRLSTPLCPPTRCRTCRMSNSSRSGIMPWPRSRKPCSPSLAGDELMSELINEALERFDLEAKNLAAPGQPVRHAVVTHALGTIRYPCLRVGHLKFWSGRRDSNPRPRPWQGRALPLSYTRIRERPAVGNRRARHLCQKPPAIATIERRPPQIAV